MRPPLKQGDARASTVPNDKPPILLVYAPPDSGKSTFVTNLITREDHGFRGRRKNLITREAQKDVADDNVYDPQVLDDPEVQCFPVAELKDAELHRALAGIFYCILPPFTWRKFAKGSATQVFPATRGQGVSAFVVGVQK